MDSLTNVSKKIIARILVFAYLCVSSIFLPVYADEPPRQLEQKIKAGLVYNLLKYTIWPKDPALAQKDDLQICLFGDDPFDGYLAPLQGRTAQQFLISISHIKQINETDSCDVIIVHRNQEKRVSELLDYLGDKHILTISDINQFSRRGGMIEMAREDEKISLYVNKDAIDHAGLDIEEHMLKLAKIVSR